MRVTVLVVAVLVLAGCGGDGSGGERAGTATSEAGSKATPLPAVALAELEAGKHYVSRKFTPKITLTIPTAGWVISSDVPDHVEIEPPTEQPVEDAGIGFHHMTKVFDPVKGGEIPGDAVAGPDDFAAWLVDHPHLTTTKPKPVEALGLRGVSIDARVKSGQSKVYRDCGKVDPEVCVVMFIGAIEPVVWGRSSKTRFLVLDQPDGRQLVVELWVDPAKQFAGEAKLLQRVVASASVATR